MKKCDKMGQFQKTGLGIDSLEKVHRAKLEGVADQLEEYYEVFFFACQRRVPQLL
jgi:hypothetical protein